MLREYLLSFILLMIHCFVWKHPETDSQACLHPGSLALGTSVFSSRRTTFEWAAAQHDSRPLHLKYHNLVSLLSSATRPETHML
jgi:hypothetical protein